MNWLFRALLQCIVGDRGAMPTIRAAQEALEDGGPLNVVDEDLTQSIPTGDVSYTVAKQLRNSKLSIMYFRSEHDQEVRESIDILIQGMNGGIVVWLTDGVVVSWERLRVTMPPMNTSDNYNAQLLMGAVRHCCGLA